MQEERAGFNEPVSATGETVAEIEVTSRMRLVLSRYEGLKGEISAEVFTVEGDMDTFAAFANVDVAMAALPSLITLAQQHPWNESR